MDEPRQRGEKDEKEREERYEKEEKEEKSRSDPLSTIVWAAIFVWAGLVLLADNLGMLKGLALTGWEMGAWSLVFVGAGLIILAEVVVRLVVPAYRRPVTGSIIFAGILLAIGLGGWVGWNMIWPVILILIGVSILVGQVVRR